MADTAAVTAPVATSQRSGPDLARAALNGEETGRAIARILLHAAREKVRRAREQAESQAASEAP
jgi:hypothetical protein